MIGSYPRFRVTVCGPDGIVHDLTERVSIDLGSLTSEMEEDLTQFVHDDLDLELCDEDGWCSAYFGAARPKEAYEIVIERETGRRRPRWERIFAGLPDLPPSLTRDHRERLASLQVFSYSKLLEFASAHDLKRTVEGRTASVSAGSATVNVSDTTGLEADDEITLSKNGEEESGFILSVDSGTQLTMKEAFSDSFGSASLILETPYYRRKTVEELAVLVFEQAGISSYTIDVNRTLSLVPFPTSLNTSGLAGTPAGLLDAANEIKVYAGSKRYGGESPTSGFTDEGSDAAKCDWYPYLTSEPATLRAADTTDDGRRAWDYAGGHYFHVAQSGDDLIIFRDGSAWATAHTGPSSYDSLDYLQTSIEVNPTRGDVWVAYFVQWEASAPLSKTFRYRLMKRFALSDASLVGTSAGVLYSLRYCRTLGGILAKQYSGSLDSFIDDQPLALFGDDGSIREFAHAKGVVTWTLRAWDRWLGALRVDDGQTRIVVWDAATGSIAADHWLADSTASPHFATVFVGADTKPVYICYGGGTWAVVSSSATGVVPYADFEDSSCAEAMKQLAIASCAFLRVDHWKHGYLIARQIAPEAFGLYPREIDEPLERSTQSLWDSLRTSVSVVGVDEFGEEFEVIVGDQGDSARRLELDAPLISTPALAEVIAAKYLEWLERQLVEETLVIEEPSDGPIRVLERIKYEGRELLVMSVDSDFTEREQEIRAIGE